MAFLHFFKIHFQKKSHLIALAISIATITALFLLRLMPYQAPLTTYQFMIRLAQQYLEPHLEGLDLYIHRYQEFDFGFQIAWTILAIMGVIWVYGMTRKPDWLFRSWVICFIKISAIKAIQWAALASIFTATLISSFFIYFGLKLQNLKSQESTGNFIFQLLEKFNPFYFLKAGWNAFNTLLKAQDLFMNINRVNYGVYVGCQLAGIITFILFFIFVARNLNRQVR